MRLEGGRLLVECFLCQREVQQGPHVYESRYVASWDINVCDMCLDANWDGIAPATHQRLRDHLKEQKIEPKLTQQGWIAWPDGTHEPGHIPGTRSARA